VTQSHARAHRARTIPGIALAGISYSRTPARVRERLQLTPDEAGALIGSLTAGEGEAVVLVTCNRTEVYVTGRNSAAAGVRARLVIERLGGSAIPPESIYVHSGEDAARHLFRVASGLDSIVLGDTHVTAQVRGAHRAARAAGGTGPLLDRLFDAASGASKRVRSQTSISSGSTSVPAAAIASAARTAGPLRDRRVLIVGAGKIASLAALSAWSRGCRDITVLNRTLARADAVAERVGGRAGPLDRLSRELATADVVVTATGSRGFVVTDEELGGSRPLAIFDLALPRDVAPSVRDTVPLFDLDSLGCMIAESGARKHADLERAETIVRKEATRYEAWRRARAAAPAISALRDDAERTRRTVLARHTTRLARLGGDERELVETITRQLVSQFVHAPTLELRSQVADV
jgi:glutamyl-tRNA reductase